MADRQLDVLAFGDGRLVSPLRVSLGWAAGGRARHFTAWQVTVKRRGGPAWASVDGEVLRAAEVTLTGVALMGRQERCVRDYPHVLGSAYGGA
ncbi:hypothetical protein DAETH_45270 (plasmid) [Deinococcus aetherius]|uniref:Uncharacterized protein n=1 Tax=Deinococcus aetherius TaxID=200252 RepID=A0ABM8AL51_9DEIO|nr:hypothetical protein [Deinococcus aetherius]BDP44558.1 hypothetical protein DAETH_45270 [Deinococcus aetherius]